MSVRTGVYPVVRPPSPLWKEDPDLSGTKRETPVRVSPLFKLSWTRPLPHLTSDRSGNGFRYETEFGEVGKKFEVSTLSRLGIRVERGFRRVAQLTITRFVYIPITDLTL